MNNFKNFISDILCIASIRLRVMLRSKAVIIAFIGAAIVSAFMIWTFIESAEEKSTIPIGVIDLDESASSRQLVKSLSEDKALSVYVDSEQKLNDMLNDGKIYSIFIIYDGFEDNIINLKTDKLIEHKYLQVYECMTVLSDIVLSKILDDICYAYSLEEYHKVGDKYTIESDEDFRKFVDEIYSTYESLFSFDLEVVNIQNKEDVTENLKNSLIYKRIVIAVIGILVSFVILFAVNTINSDSQFGTDRRIRISLVGRISSVIGDFMAVILVGSVFSVISCSFVIIRIGFKNIVQSLTFISIILIYTMCVDLVFIIISRLIVDRIVYQLIGAFIVCILGVSGALNIIDVFIPDTFLEVVKKVPSAICDKGFTELIINENADKQITQLFITFGVLFVGTVVVDYLKNIKERYL